MTRSRRRKLSRLAARLAGVQLASTLLGQAAATDTAQADAVAGDASTLEEVLVTAEKRTESLQSVPISVEALDSKRLEELNVTDFDSVAKYLPSLAYQTLGPSQAQIYFRGITNGSDGLKVGSSAMVGVYLDEQPVTTIGTALDIHIYDMERIEALAGPQGTLFGASSMAGTVRYITNKPDTSHTYGGYDITGSRMSHGGGGDTLEGFFNLALSDRAALRLVGYSERDPGYINNVAGPPEVFPTSGVPRDNAAFRRNDYNNVGTEGARAALKVDLDDRWTVLPSIIWQKQGANGSFAYEPSLGFLNVATYAPMRNDDQWYQAALTVEGRIGNFDLTYAGGYMRRTINNVVDYSDYSYAYDTFYANNPAYFGDLFLNSAGKPISPAQTLVSYDLLSKHTHELRLASPKDARLRFVLGAFYEDQGDVNRYRYYVTGLADSLSITGQPGVHYENAITRRDVDRAVFSDITYDLTPQLALTLGARLFGYDSSAAGFFGFNGNYSVGEALCVPRPTPATAGPIAPCQNVNAITAHGHYTDKATLSYKLDADRLLYATYSTGFRQGGFNRNPFVPPYGPDYLSNYEVGWKTAWAGQTVRFNGALFLEDWRDAQFGVNGPFAITQIINAGGARTEGVESSLEWLLRPGLTLTSSGTYLWKHNLTQDACIAYSAAPHCGSAGNLAAPEGTQMPVSPSFKANLSLRYEFSLASGYRPYVQGAGVYQTSARSLLPVADETVLGPIPAYGTIDLSGGVRKSNWHADLNVTNVFDTHGQLSRYLQCNPSFCTTPYVVPVRPRTVSLQFGQRF